jgi:hypothetical protein
MSQEANEILKGRSHLNRNLYQQKIRDAAEVQSEQQQPTFYTGLDSATGKGQLQSIDGKKIYGKSQTNGAVGKGDSIRLRGDFYDNLPRRKQENPVVNTNKITPNTGLVIFRDVNWLDIPDENNKKFFYQIIKFFLNKNTIYTIGADSRIYILPIFVPPISEAGTIYGVSSFEGHRIPINISEIIEEKKIKIEIIDLKQKNSYLKVKSCFILPLFNTSDYEFTGIEVQNLHKIAQRQGLVIISEWIFWDEYTEYLLRTFNLLDRIQVGNNYTSVNWVGAERSRFKFSDGIVTNNATGTFVNVPDKEKLLVINESSGLFIGSFIGDNPEYIAEGELRDIPLGTPSAIYVQSKDLKL